MTLQVPKSTPLCDLLAPGDRPLGPNQNGMTCGGLRASRLRPALFFCQPPLRSGPQLQGGLLCLHSTSMPLGNLRLWWLHETWDHLSSPGFSRLAAPICSRVPSNSTAASGNAARTAGRPPIVYIRWRWSCRQLRPSFPSLHLAEPSTLPNLRRTCFSLRSRLLSDFPGSRSAHPWKWACSRTSTKLLPKPTPRRRRGPYRHLSASQRSGSRCHWSSPRTTPIGGATPRPSTRLSGLAMRSLLVSGCPVRNS